MIYWGLFCLLNLAFSRKLTLIFFFSFFSGRLFPRTALFKKHPFLFWSYTSKLDLWWWCHSIQYAHGSIPIHSFICFTLKLSCICDPSWHSFPGLPTPSLCHLPQDPFFVWTFLSYITQCIWFCAVVQPIPSWSKLNLFSNKYTNIVFCLSRVSYLCFYLAL